LGFKGAGPQEDAMPHRYAEIAFTPTVKKAQEEQGSRGAYARMESAPETRNHRLRAAEAQFIAARNSFYMATVGETGWPYIQHRGGPTGFVRVLDDATIGFADFRGNRQYISVGNMMTNDRVSLFFMDYPNKTRLKLFGRAKIIGPDDGATLSRLEIADYRARVERGFLIRVEGFDWNCPQHITERYTLDEVRALTAPLAARIAELEAQLTRNGKLAPIEGVSEQNQAP
jgi:predicted pyridoxine 5'-phosphate oxidase superfamily flavin-nucleotide-binding protein